METYVCLISGRPESPVYYQAAPVEFKDPGMSMSLIPVTAQMLSGDRPFYTADDIRSDNTLLKSAYDNTARNKVRLFSENGYLTVRSAETGIPCAAAFMLSTKQKLFEALNIDIKNYYITFITYDEVLLADRAKSKPSSIRRHTMNVKNRLVSSYGDGTPLLSTEVFTYDNDRDCYIEV